MFGRRNLPVEWTKRNMMIPAPRLVGVELNPGPLTEDERKDIIRWKKEKLSNKQIAKKLKRNIKTVRRWVKRCYKPPSKKGSFKNRPGQGGKRKLSRKQENRVLKKAKKGKDAPEIASEMSKEVKGGIKERTIQRTLKEGGLKYLVREEREIITRKQAQKRLAFCKKYLNHDWRLCLFMDEKTFEVGTHKKKGWQDPHDRTVTKVTRHPIKVHVWAGIGLHFKTKLYFFKQNLNSDIYCKILKSRLPPAKAFDLKPHEGSKWILVQDNDPKHKSAQSQKLLDILAPDRLKDWSSNSPDFNIMEDGWSWMEGELQRKGPKSLRALKSQLTTAWNNLPMSKVENSIQSLPKRFQQCIDLNGERTSY